LRRCHPLLVGVPYRNIPSTGVNKPAQRTARRPPSRVLSLPIIGRSPHKRSAQAAGIYRQGQIAASSKLAGPHSEPVVPHKQMPAKQVPRRCQADAKQMPSRCRGDKQPDEAMPSSRGGSRAAKRARTGGAKIAPWRLTRSTDLDPIREQRSRFAFSGGIGSST
jgi:hypothetical protein